jgi:hypothetical protein
VFAKTLTAGPQSPEVAIEARGERIVATLRGTDFATAYRRTADWIAQSEVTMADRHASVPHDDFEKLAWEAALQKARELGWIG